MLQAWIDGSAKPPVQGARMMLIALAREVLTWREDHLRKQRCSIETESGTFQIEIPKEAMDRIRALVRRGSHRPPGDREGAGLRCTHTQLDGQRIGS